MTVVWGSDADGQWRTLVPTAYQAEAQRNAIRQDCHKPDAREAAVLLSARYAVTP